jgi:uncharacterized membrane protein HdeD (DUF308 family)
MTMNNDAGQERARAAAAAIRTDVSDKLGGLWWSFLLRGAFAIALGLFALFWPSASLGIFVVAVGLYCIADGLTGLIAAIRYPELREQLVQAVIVVGLGVVLLLWPGATLRVLLVLLGAAALLAGAGQILTALRLPADDPERGTILIIGSATALVGLAVAVWPAGGIAVISWVIGIAAILLGALLISIGSRFKRLGARLDTPVGQ